ncbi:FGGY-family carbohydrate kinase [Histidinibacterium aquaticum]|uniref:Carbohydrate kinase n=1 Tax=Histidinibacterium aquaticum TaxID=2613962 RepID=A0A5J5GRB3_9RHOB|nr:FGGY-family carbohydrate kinase [Histidinibacterium aquaticum]KAA9010098.1 carbohydrate kinase [Histidinibacterium aquaticum]
MSELRHIAVIDIGKTNAKLALVDAVSLEELAVETRPNTVRPGPPWPHFDLDGHWAFLLDALGRMHREHGVDAVSVTTHGASGVLLDAEGELAAPMLDYEHDGPDSLAEAYDALRPPFSETGSPRLPRGLNLGAQLHWMLETDPGLRDRTAHFLTYPQYWGYRLTGTFATDVTSLGCHTDLWNPWKGAPSSLVERLGLTDAIAPARRSFDRLGPITEEVAKATGLAPDTPVACGIHDSNASLYPHLAGREPPFSVVSTGTWVVAMAVGASDVTLDPARDTLVNVDARGEPVPSARFMGGREFETIREGQEADPSAEDRAAVLRGLYLRPAVVTGSGPFPERSGGFTSEPGSTGQRMLALSYYLALMTDTCLSLIGARGPVIVEGPFARNEDYLQMLAALRDGPVEASTSATGTSTGGALLFAQTYRDAPGRRIVPQDAEALRTYAAGWRSALETR